MADIALIALMILYPNSGTSTLIIPLNKRCCPQNYTLNTDQDPGIICTNMEEKLNGSNYHPMEHPALQKCSQRRTVKEVMISFNFSVSGENTCFENITTSSGVSKIISVTCSQGYEFLEQRFLLNIFTGAGVISLFSLLIIFIVYWYVPDFNTLHGRIVLSNVLSITCVNIFFLTVYNINPRRIFCTIIGYFGYYSTISMFCWMTIMCFDLFYTLFKGFSPNTRSMHCARFTSYSVVGWGLGLLLMLMLITLQKTLPLESDFNPDVGGKFCFISDENNKQLFIFHLPILVNMVFNISMFISIIILLKKSNMKTKEARDSIRRSGDISKLSGKLEKAKEENVLYMRLVLVLGIPWSVESLHFLIHNHYEQPCERSTPVQAVLRFMDFCNMLRGFFMFLIFICKKSVWRKVKRYWFLRSRAPAFEMMDLERKSTCRSAT